MQFSQRSLIPVYLMLGGLWWAGILNRGIPETPNLISNYVASFSDDPCRSNQKDQLDVVLRITAVEPNFESSAQAIDPCLISPLNIAVHFLPDGSGTMRIAWRGSMEPCLRSSPLDAGWVDMAADLEWLEIRDGEIPFSAP